MKELKQKTYTALRKSERIFKTDMVYLAHGGSWLTIIQFVAAISSFALSVAFAHYFPKDQYGTYKYITALAGIISSLSLTGLGTAVAQSVARGFGGALREGFKENLKWSWGIFLISIVGAVYYALHHNTLLSISFLIIGVTTPFINGSSLFNSYLNGKKAFKPLAYLMAFRNTLPAIILIISLLYTKNLILIVLIYFASNLLIGLVTYYLTLKFYSPNDNKDRGMLSYAKHLSLLSVLNTLADQVDKVIVYHYIGAVELAIYTFATAIPLQLKGVLKGVYSLALPKFAAGDLNEIRKHLPSKMKQFLYIITVSVVLYIFAAPYIYKIFFPRYVDVVRMSQIFSLSLLAYISIIPGTLLQAKRSVRSLYNVHIIVAIIKIILLFVGVSFWGIWGVIFARITYEYAGLLIIWLNTKTAKEGF